MQTCLFHLRLVGATLYAVCGHSLPPFYFTLSLYSILFSPKSQISNGEVGRFGGIGIQYSSRLEDPIALQEAPPNSASLAFSPSFPLAAFD